MIYYTDGSTHPTNPGPGGFGVVIVDDYNKIYDTYSKQSESITTNNAEEIKAILFAVCHAIGIKETEVTIYSDSSYAINSLSSWKNSWKKNGWLKSDGKVPENLDLIKAYDSVEKFVNVKFIKVKAHNGNYYNELADKLARGEVN